MNFFPKYEADFFLAIARKKNTKAQKLLQKYPIIDINYYDDVSVIPYALYACRHHDNAEMLEFLLNRGFILAPYLKQEFFYALTNNKPALTKLFLQHGALNSLTTHEQVNSFVTLLKQLAHHTPEEQHEYLELFASSKLTITTDQARTLLFILLGECLTHSNLYTYSKHVLSDIIKSQLENLPKKTHLWSTILRGLTLLKKWGIDLQVKQPDYTTLMRTLAYKGCTELMIYLLHKNPLLTVQNMHEILSTVPEHIPDEQAAEFIRNTVVNSLIPKNFEHTKTIENALADFLLEHWTNNNNKNIVKLLRRFIIIQRLFTPCTTPEIAHKIAQYDTDSFHTQTLGYLPSYEEVQEFIAQKARECTP